MNTSSLIGPVTAAIAAMVNHDGNGTLTGSWDMGDGVILGYPDYTGFNYYYTNTGSYTASFGVTESRYNRTSSVYTQSLSSSEPSLNVFMTLVTSSAVGPVTGTFQVSHSYNGSGTVQGLLRWGDGGWLSYNNPAMASQSYEHGYSNTGSFTASFALTESYYNLTTSLVTASFSASKPALTATLTLNTGSGTAPTSNGSYTASYSYVGNGTVVGKLDFGDGYDVTIPPASAQSGRTWPTAGNFTASYAVTESSYNIATAAKVNTVIP
jgi:hypothetical protein